METHRIAIFLRDGMAWVAEIDGGRAAISPLTAWLSAHPGRAAVRSLALGAMPPRRTSAPRALRMIRIAARLLDRLRRRPIASGARATSGLASR